MLEYSKTILEKVAFDEFLFQKELRKAKRLLNRAEIKELEKWCSTRFGGRFGSLKHATQYNDTQVEF